MLILSSMSIFKLGQRYISKNEPELGIGRVFAIQGKNVSFEFSAVNQTRIYRVHDAPVKRYKLEVGETGKIEKGTSFLVNSIQEEEGLLVYYTRSGKKIMEADLASKSPPKSSDLFRFLLENKRSSLEDFRRREQAQQLSCEWQSSSVRGMVGPKVDMLEHQFYLTHRACASSSLPRLMLSDEVGLGKTIEAGMIWHALKTRSRIVRTIVLVPESLKHQWMVEMKRRFNQVFTLVDHELLESLYDESTETMKENPFLQSNEVICTIEHLIEEPALIEDLLKFHWDLIIVDEAHHLICEDGFTSKEYVLVNRIVGASAGGVLFLTGTPLHLEPESHFNRLKILDPVRFSSYEDYLKDLNKYQRLAKDLEKLPVDSSEPLSWDALYDLVPKNSSIREWLEKENSKSISATDWMRRIVDALGTGFFVFRNTRKGVGGFPKRILNEIPLEPNPDYRALIAGIVREKPNASTILQEKGLLVLSNKNLWLMDEKVIWLKKFLEENKDKKFLLICEDLSMVLALEYVLKSHFSDDFLLTFHENMSILARDQAAAQFANSEIQLLIASEIGSEGRNFQFVHHLILFDLPLDAALVEQRIGRLDRIGQKHEVVIHVPYVQRSGQEVLFRWYHEGLGVFTEPLMSGGELFLKYTVDLVEAIDVPHLKLEHFKEKILPMVREDSIEMRKNIEKGRDKLLEFNSKDTVVARQIIEEIKEVDADPSMKNFVFDVLRAHGMDIEDKGDSENFVFRLGQQVEPGSIPGLPIGAAFNEEGGEGIVFSVTTSREQAKLQDQVEFLTREHPLAMGAIDLVTSLAKGSVSCVIWEDSGLRGLMMQYNFILEPSVLEKWGFSDIAGPVFVRVLIDANGNDVSEHLISIENAVLRDTTVPQGNAAVNAKIQFFASDALGIAKKVASLKTQDAVEKSIDLVSKRVDKEYERCQYLLTVQERPRAEEVLQVLRKKTLEYKKAALSPQLRLDAIRLIVCR
jgi:ATP-dependent helicase HepA